MEHICVCVNTQVFIYTHMWTHTYSSYLTAEARDYSEHFKSQITALKDLNNVGRNNSKF